MNPMMMGLLGPQMASQTGQQQTPQKFDLAGLLGDPRLQVGLGLLSAGHDSRINPYQAALGGMNSAQQFKLLEQKRKKEEEQQARLEQARKEALRIHGKPEFQQEVQGPPQMGQGQPMQTQANPMYSPMTAAVIQGSDDPGDWMQSMALHQKIRQGAVPTSAIQDFQFRQNLSGEQAALWDAMNARQGNVPAALKVNEAINDAIARGDIEEAKRIAALHRAQTKFDMGGGGEGLADTVLGGDRTLVEPEVATDRNAAEAAAKAEAQARGKDIGDASAQIGPYEIEMQATLEHIDQLRNHPGREGATGKSGWFNPLFPRGTERGDFMALLDTTKGKQFGIAYETLRGGGTITEIETDQATKALGNMSTAQSDEQFLQALQTFENAVLRGYQKLKSRAGRSSSGATGSWRIVP